VIRVSILYPAGGAFDMAYYLDSHMPRAIALLSQGRGYRGVSVERGVGGVAPGSPPAFLALCHYTFDSLEDFMAAFLPHAAELQSDIRNYTAIEPVIQFSEVAIQQ
jgi:uncharacterized protein (TIGR02118 family)